MSFGHASEGHSGEGHTGIDHAADPAIAPESEPESELSLELERIAGLPVNERAAEFSRVHQQLGQLLESAPVQLFDGDDS